MGISLGTNLWQHVCRIVWAWEKTNNKKIHKGTPYFFLGETLLRQGNIDLAFLFISNAIEEDKKFSKQYGNDKFYEKMPAYLFSSLIDNPYNHLYPFVKNARQDIQEHINSYNLKYEKTFEFIDFDNKFLKNDSIEYEKYFFVYSLINLENLKNITINELENNEFSKLKNLDIIFNLCLTIDNVLGEKIDRFLDKKPKKVCMGDRIQEICSQKYNISKGECYQIWKSLDFNNSLKEAINTCLSLDYKYNDNQVRKEVLNLVFIWGLRNHGGHNVESEAIFVERFEEILQLIFNSLFLILEELY